MKRRLDALLGIPLVWILSWFVKKSSARSSAIADPKILIIKLAAMGDTVLLAPVLRSLRKKLPKATIHWLVSGVNKQLAVTVPYTDKVIVWDPVFVGSFVGLVKKLRQEKYDVVVDLEQWARATAILSFFSSAPVRLGFDTPGQHRAGVFTEPILKSADQHEIYEFYNVLSAYVDLDKNTRLELWETDGGRFEYEHVPKKSKPGDLKVLLHPGCGADGLPREWPIAQYALLAHWLMRQYNADIYITGGPEEKKKTSQLFHLLNKQAIDLGGKLSWQGTVSLVKHMDAVVSGNTGVMHIAAALQKPQVALHGPTNPLLWGPLNPHAKVVQSRCPSCPCLVLGFEYHRHDQSCMEKIDISEVKSAFSSLVVKRTP